LKVILSIDPIKYPLTGIGRYTYELATALARNDEVAELLFLQGARLRTTLPEAELKPGVTRGLRSTLLKSRTAVAVYRRLVPWMKARVLRGFDEYIFHGPNFYLPPFPGRSVVTVHDLSPYSWASCHPPERVRYMQSEIELALNRAAFLITDSEFIRQEVITTFSWPQERVRVVPLASAAEFHPREPSEIADLLGRYGLVPGTYCLAVGTIEPRKNIDRLLDAYALLPAAMQRQCPLILAGYHGWSSAALHARIAAAQRSGWLRYLNFVPAGHLPALYAGARLFIFPSVYEGFGLPVLEAMASGIPVVCSNASSLPEVAGEAAAMCDAFDMEELSRLIAAGLQDAQWRSAARSKGLLQATRFSWQRCARETLAVYQAAERA